MAITNFIPSVWSENLYTQLDKQYIAVANCNREFEGDINHKGAVVKICGVGEIEIKDYTKNSDMTTAQALSDTVKELTIDKAKYFNFQIDDIDRAQSSPKLMNAAMKIAASALANAADLEVYKLFNKAGHTVYHTEVTENNILDLIIRARTKLYENNVTDAHEVVIEVSPPVAELILKAKIMFGTSDNASTLSNGYIGSICGCSVYVSKNVVVDEDNFHKCFVRTKRAIAFVDQFTEICAYRPESRFADAVKGLHLYGGKIIYPNEIALLDIALPE